MDPKAQLQQADELFRKGDEIAARDAYRRAAVSARTVFDPESEARAMFGLGTLLAAAEDHDSARSAFEEAAARAMEAGNRLLEADAHFALAHAHFDAGRSREGHDELLEAMALYRRLESDEARIGLARATRVYGEHLGVLGSVDDARQALELARLMFRELGDEEAARGVTEEIGRLDEFAR